MTVWMSAAEIAEVWDRYEAGEYMRPIARAIGRSSNAVRDLIAKTGGVRPLVPTEWFDARLSLAEREEISRGIARGLSERQIAAGLGRAPSTISREIVANGGRSRYRCCEAETSARLRARRPKSAKLARCRRLRKVVEAKLEKRWSPQQIADWLPAAFPEDPEMRVSHETIYMSLFVQGRGALRTELYRCLRHGQAIRRPQGTRLPTGKGIINDMVMISERPAEVEDRAVPGHWEGDLILGKGRRAIGTLVERSTRYVMLVRLPAGHGAPAVRKALTKRITTLPTELRRSITWDQGKELAEHLRFTVDTGVQIYFCDPRSPWSTEARGNADRTRTPTDSCANTSPKAASSLSIPRHTSTPSLGSSTAALDEHSAACHHLRHSPRLLRRPVEAAPDYRSGPLWPEPTDNARRTGSPSEC
jgi:IS30 family transposase